MEIGRRFDFSRIAVSLRGVLSKKIFASTFLAAVFAVFFASSSRAFDLTLSHGGGGSEYTLAWETIAPSTTDAIVEYYIFEEFGLDGVSLTLPITPAVLSDAIHSTRLTSVIINMGSRVGSRCFVVVSSDSLNGPGFISDNECHGFIHNLTQEGILRADGDGTQRGVDQKWTFTYSLDRDAYVTARIYPPGTQFTNNSNSFVVSAGSSPVKTLVDFTPRSGEMLSHNITMQEEWDSRSSSGVVVPNGIYYLYMQAALDSSHFRGGYPDESNLLPGVTETLLRDGTIFSIPVDILRILNIAATGISLSNPISTISYDITGDAKVRMVIAQPGSAFEVVGGQIRPIDRVTGVYDPTLIVSSSTFQRKAGRNVEAWDGLDLTGAEVPSGVYPVGLSASDDYGNNAIDASGNDYPVFTTITLERSANSDDGETTESDTTPPTLTSISPGNGSVVSSAVSTITIVLADSESSLLLNSTVISVRDPNNSTVIPVISNDGNNTVTLYFATPLSTNGTYNLTVTARDNPGNSVTFNLSFTINIRLESGAFEGSYILFPNPAKNTNVTFQYSLSVPAAVEIEIFNILGERVYSINVNDTAGTIQRTWDLKNNDGEKVGSGMYLVKIKANGTGGSNVEAIKKLVVIQ